MERHEYDATAIKPLRAPESEEVAGGWWSRWLLRLNTAPPATALEDVARRLSADCDSRVVLHSAGGREVRLGILTPMHPMLPDSFPLVDPVLVGIDAALGGIEEINGSPRDWWRTFRMRRC